MVEVGCLVRFWSALVATYLFDANTSMVMMMMIMLNRHKITRGYKWMSWIFREDNVLNTMFGDVRCNSVNLRQVFMIYKNKVSGAALRKFDSLCCFLWNALCILVLETCWLTSHLLNLLIETRRMCQMVHEKHGSQRRVFVSQLPSTLAENLWDPWSSLGRSWRGYKTKTHVWKTK